MVAQDEKRIQTGLKYNLKLNGFEVPLPEDGPVGLNSRRKRGPNLFIKLDDVGNGQRLQSIL